MNWFCVQIGAREHYAVPRALQQAGRSMRLYTEFWAGPTIRRMAAGTLRSLGARCHPDLDRGERTTIKSWNFRALLWEKRRRSVSSARTPYHGFIEVGRRFAVRVREDLKRRKDLGADTILYAYDTGALEAFEWCRERGIKCVLNQMDPNRVEVDLVRAEEKQWPGWAPQVVNVPEEYFVRREREWALADRIVVNSEFSRQALLQQGVPVEKLMIIPLCFEKHHETTGLRTTDNGPTNAKTTGGRTTDNETEFRGQKSVVSGQRSVVSGQSSRPLRVLFLGQVILRKGIQYLMAAAKLLEKENIQFDVVGPVGISQEAMATVPANMTFHGRTGRDQAAGWYQRSHLFVLPTLSDGFAITQLEAMAHGVPVVATPNCGEVVSEGVDGFIVPARDAAALADTFRRYLQNPELLRTQSAAALVKARQFTIERLAENLVQLEADLLKPGPLTTDHGLDQLQNGLKESSKPSPATK